MSDWKQMLAANTSSWRAVEGYADERIADLTATCTAPESTDTQIRQAQAGILELQRLKSLPAMVTAEGQIRQAMGSRKEY